ncbi:TRAP transporter small permease [Jannaschia formosa]|uniref:TRAP transporter small permease n=1 Tax=Jannaschia formosa TaxID=2259592 RepID=UPI000E1BCD70|nr:TRAP transporter small permease [Jannaschia formosa]TFL18050.1 TRAP transporter small permease [Jannaschia formosa]
MLARIERLLLDLSVAAIAALGLLIAMNVALRATLNTGIPDAIVMVQELMVAAILLPLAAATAARGHIVVEVLSKRLPGRVQDWLVVTGSVVGLLALLPLIYAGWREAAKTIESGSFFFGELLLPKWPGRVAFLIGMGACALRLAVLAVQDVATIRAGGHLVPRTTSDVMGEP